MESRWLHIPMEIVDRELYPKLLLASEAVKEGWECIIGTKRSLVNAAAQIPPGVVYLKSVIPSEIHHMRTYKKHGHRLVSLDEEGLVQSSLNTLVTSRYCEETVNETERFFCWGEIQCEALQERYKSNAEKFTPTGSPTADLWRLKARDIFKDRVAALHARFGKYIIIPSSFGVPNHFMGPIAALEIMERDNMFRDQADYDYYKRYHDYVAKVFEKFLEILPLIAREFPNHTVIVRPHPSENHDTWKRAMTGLPNVKVLFEDSVSPWLLGADAIFHWGSTTGIEAHLMGRPVVAYTPYPEEEKAYDVLPHLVSIMTHTPQDALKALHEVMDHPADWMQSYPDVIAGHETMRRWIYNIDNKPAYENVIRGINNLNVKPQAFKGTIPTGIRALTLKEAIWSVLDIIRKVPALVKLLPEKTQIGIKSRAYGRQKTKPLTLNEIQQVLDIFSGHTINATKIGNDLFRIKKI